MELGIGIGWLATGWSASGVKLGITSSLDGGVMFDALPVPVLVSDTWILYIHQYLYLYLYGLGHYERYDGCLSDPSGPD